MRTLLRLTTGFGLLLAVSLQSLWAEEVTLEHNGLQLRADLELAEGKDFKDGIVLLQHGTLAHNHMEIMQSLASLLNENGYSALSVNLGYGIDKRPSKMLDCTIEHKHKHEDAIDELDAWMTWLNEKGAGKVAMLGHSRGGNQVAWYAAEKDSDLLDKVILVAPGTWNAEKSAQGYEERYKKPLAEIMARARKLVDEGKGDTIMDLPGFVYCEKARASAAAVLSYYRDDARKNTPDLLSKITKPVLIVVGSEDKVVADLPAKLEGMMQKNVTVETIDGADHFFRDLYGEELTDQVTEFINW